MWWVTDSNTTTGESDEADKAHCWLDIAFPSGSHRMHYAVGLFGFRFETAESGNIKELTPFAEIKSKRNID